MNTRIFLLRIGVLLMAMAGLSSCEKVIDLDLRESETKVVIEGTVTNQTGPYTVRVSQSVSFNASGNGTPLNNATVTINDDTGQSETLQAVGNGQYQTRSLVGQPGRTYTLTVSVDGQTYTARSTMPRPIQLDELTYEDLAFGQKAIFVHFDDPVNTTDYYRFVLYINDKKQNAIFTDNDRLRNGIRTRIALASTNQNDDTDLETNDVARVEMYCIDSAVYDYFKSLADLLSGQIASPANPNSNLSGGALGYFSAQTVSTNSLTIP